MSFSLTSVVTRMSPKEIRQQNDRVLLARSVVLQLFNQVFTNLGLSKRPDLPFSRRPTLLGFHSTSIESAKLLQKEGPQRRTLSITPQQQWEYGSACLEVFAYPGVIVPLTKPSHVVELGKLSVDRDEICVEKDDTQYVYFGESEVNTMANPSDTRCDQEVWDPTTYD